MISNDVSIEKNAYIIAYLKEYSILLRFYFANSSFSHNLLLAYKYTNNVKVTDTEHNLKFLIKCFWSTKHLNY